jgi:hypothetical protein
MIMNPKQARELREDYRSAPMHAAFGGLYGNEPFLANQARHRQRAPSFSKKG